MVQKDDNRVGSHWRSNPWDGQTCERRPHPYWHRRTWCFSWQLVDPFELCGFRHDARKASSWFQERCRHCIASRKRRIKRTTKIGRKAPPLRGGNGKLLVASFIWDITTTMDLTLIERWILRKALNRTFSCGMSLTKNLVQNYSDHFSNSLRSSLTPMGV